MILYVDMEHQMGRSAAWGTRIMAGRLKVKYRIEEITGETCLIAHYSSVNPAFLAEHRIKAVLLSGSGTDPQHYDEKNLEGVQSIVREPPAPVLGLCGGWQFMAQAFGATITPMGPFPPGEAPDETPAFVQKGIKFEIGYLPVEVMRRHPLVESLGRQPSFFHAHYLEIHPPPAGFRIYARTEMCRTQLVVHDRLPLYGTQFHPEHYDDDHPDGKIVLLNFFNLAGIDTGQIG